MYSTDTLRIDFTAAHEDVVRFAQDYAVTELPLMHQLVYRCADSQEAFREAPAFSQYFDSVEDVKEYSELVQAYHAAYAADREVTDSKREYAVRTVRNEVTIQSL